MIKKKGIAVVFLAVLLSALSVLVSAQDFFARGDFFYSLENSLSPFLTLLFGTSGFLFEKVMFLLILLTVIYSVAIRIPAFEDKKGVCWVISICISLIAVRFLTNVAWVKSVILPYGAFGVGLLAFIPTLIFFYFVERGIESSLMRKIAWILYSVVYFGMWYERYYELQGTAWIYFMTAVFSIIMVLADGSIQGMFVRRAVKQGLNDQRVQELVKMQNKITEIMKLLETAHGDHRRNLMKQLAEAEKTYKKLSKGPY